MLTKADVSSGILFTPSSDQESARPFIDGVPSKFLKGEGHSVIAWKRFRCSRVFIRVSFDPYLDVECSEILCTVSIEATQSASDIRSVCQRIQNVVGGLTEIELWTCHALFEVEFGDEESKCRQSWNRRCSSKYLMVIRGSEVSCCAEGHGTKKTEGRVVLIASTDPCYGPELRAGITGGRPPQPAYTLKEVGAVTTGMI